VLIAMWIRNVECALVSLSFVERLVSLAACRGRGEEHGFAFSLGILVDA
jgi:hypothetical protein